jgi:CHAD domain-containing protein
MAMAFHFKKKKSVSKVVRRLCRARIENALAFLEKDDRLAAVHDVRKDIKKARAVLRLVRRETTRNFYRKGNRRLRAAANCLTAARDARVKLNAFEKLVHHFSRKLSPRPFPKTKRLLKKHRRAAEKQFLRDGSIGKAKHILQKTKRQFDGFEIKASGWAAIAPGLKKSFARGRKALETVRTGPSPENFHEWRKRVKDLWYQVRMLRPACPKGLRAAADELKMLGELLGDDHDLVLLKEFVAKADGEMEEAKWLNRLIDSWQKELRSAALKSGERFFPEKPAVFCRQLKSRWKFWRAEK